VPPDGEGGCLAAFQLREASACRAPGNDRRHESIYAAPPFSRPYRDESAAISKAASPACRAATHTHGELDAASAAFEVGYESPSQFNREYRRFFGRPPIRDIKALRDGKVVEITTA
jgi:AraC-like DNA-binding protein